jgi:hypothetical protein
MGGDEDPAKAGARRLMGTFDAPTYISIGDDYTKKISERSKRCRHAAGRRHAAFPCPTVHLLLLLLFLLLATQPAASSPPDLPADA